MTKQQLQEDLKQAMLAKDELKTSVLRMILSALNYYEINKGGAGYEATEEDILQVLQKEAKQRKDSIEQFRNAERTDLVDKEEKELEILSKYLPEQMTKDQIRAIVQEVIRDIGATSVVDMGKVMSIIIPQTKGKTDGGLVSKIVKEELMK